MSNSGSRRDYNICQEIFDKSGKKDSGERKKNSGQGKKISGQRKKNSVSISSKKKSCPAPSEQKIAITPNTLHSQKRKYQDVNDEYDSLFSMTSRESKRLKEARKDYQKLNKNVINFKRSQLIDKNYQKALIETNANMVTCEFCGKSFKHFETLQEHKLAHKNNWECQNCEESFTSEKSLKDHQTFKHSLIECKICERKYLTVENYKDHMKMQHELVAYLSCNVQDCRSAYFTYQEFQQHKNLHYIWNQQLQKCLNCDKHVRSFEHYQYHFERECPVKICAFCDEKFQRDEIVYRDHLEFNCDKFPKDKKQFRQAFLIEDGMKQLTPGIKYVEQSQFEVSLNENEVQEQLLDEAAPPSPPEEPEDPSQIEERYNSWTPESWILENQDLANDSGNVSFESTQSDLNVTMEESNKEENVKIMETEQNIEGNDQLSEILTSEKNIQQEIAEITEMEQNVEENNVQESNEVIWDNEIQNIEKEEEESNTIIIPEDVGEFVMTQDPMIKTEELKSKMYKCQFCRGKLCRSEQELFVHYRAKHIQSEERPYPCKLCQVTILNHTFNKSFEKRDGLMNHMNAKHAEHLGGIDVSTGKWPCEDCGALFSTKPEIVQHKTQAHKEPFSTCPNCGRLFTSKAAMLDHKDLSHNDSENFQCPDCSRSFKSESSFLYHSRSVHNKNQEAYKSILPNETIKQFNARKCKICDEAFKNPKKARTHQLKQVCSALAGAVNDFWANY